MKNEQIEASIINRRSNRAYTSASIDAYKIDAIKDILHNTTSPFGGTVRYEVVTIESNSNEPLKLGTYGTIKGAKNYLLSAVKQEPMAMETLGYQMEMAVLEASALGLGTCWLGGTFKRSQFAQVLNLQADEVLPIVIPFGYPADKEGFIGGMIRNFAGSNQRKPWQELFYEGTWLSSGALGTALTEGMAGAYAKVLEMVRMGPSASNKQPWRIVKTGKHWHFILCHTKGYGTGLGYDIQRVDMGIAVCHFEMGARAMGLQGTWQRLDTFAQEKRDDMSYIISWIEA